MRFLLPHRISSLFIFLLVSCVSTAKAVSVSFDFTGDVYAIQSNGVTEDINAGSIYGKFTYDTIETTKSSVVNDIEHWADYSFLSGASIQIQWNDVTLNQTLNSAVVANNYNPVNGYYLDRFFISSVGANTALDSVDWIQLWIDGNTQSRSELLSSTNLLTSAPDMSLINSDSSVVVLHLSNAYISARITSLTISPEAVPLPASSQLLFSAFAALSFVRKLRRRKS